MGIADDRSAARCVDRFGPSFPRARVGSRSIRIFSISATPLRLSSASARTQYGQTAGAVHDNRGHSRRLLVVTGRPACSTQAMPPLRLKTRSNPRLAQRAAGRTGSIAAGAADDDGLVLELVQFAQALGRSGRARCGGRWGCGRSTTRPVSRTSSTMASSRLISSVASATRDALAAAANRTTTSACRR